MALQILYEDNHLLAVCKPVGLPTMGAAGGAASLVTIAKDYIKAKYGKPGNVYLGIVSRLDSLATGVVLFARTSKAAARLTELFRTGGVKKRYLVVTEVPPVPDRGMCVDWVRKSEIQQRMQVASSQDPGAKQAQLRYRLLQRMGAAGLVEVELLTGRKHQIRLQLSHRGWAVAGDRKYGARMPWSSGIALHARSLELRHPVRATPLRLVAPLPVAWQRWHITADLDREGD
jgi:23S rRNA pseudouridine1911/1915/1917 synthase